MPKQEPSGEVPGVSGPDVNVSGGQGVVIGSGNIQNNNWMHESPLDPASLRMLNPHAAADRIREVSHARAVDALAKASPNDVTEALRVLLAVDEEKAVAVLADVNPGKAAELIEPLAQEVPWLESLPRAAVATAKHATGLGWGRGKIGLLEHLSSGTEGYVRDCDKGSVYWSAAYGIQTVTGKIKELHEAEFASYDGFPIAPQGPAMKSPYGNEGIFQEFEECAIFSSALGTYLVPAENIMSAYEHAGRSGGRLGFPRTEVRFLRYWLLQLFEGGAICESYIDEYDAYAVFSDVLAYLEDIGGLTQWLALTPESVGKASPLHDAYRVQHFGEFKGEMLTVYSSGEHGVHGVRGKIRDYYESNQAAASWLGLPVGDQDEFTLGLRQRFEFGTVFARPGNMVLAVPSETIELYSQDRRISERLGWPTSEEFAAGKDETVRIQFFDNGVVTLRDGKREICLRLKETIDPRRSDRYASPTSVPEL